MKIHSIWYRSVLMEDESLWCESSSLKEVMRMSAGKNAIIQEYVTYLTQGEWNTIDETYADE